MPYWCTDCRSYFSVRTGTALECSRLPLRKWAIAIYLEVTSLKSVSSMKLHRDIGVSQRAAWFMLHRIREAWKPRRGSSFSGPVEVDETFIGGKAKNMQTCFPQTTATSSTQPSPRTNRSPSNAFGTSLLGEAPKRKPSPNCDASSLSMWCRPKAMPPIAPGNS